MTDHLRTFQSGPPAKISGKVHVGFMACMVVMLYWPHTELVRQFIAGFAAIGELEHTGVFRKQERPHITSREDFLRDAIEVIDQIEKRTSVNETDEIIFEAAMKDFKKGFAEEPVPRSEMDRRFGLGRWKPMPSFNITQASGKNRAIADGKKVGHNDASGGQDKLDVVSAYQPVIHIKAFIKATRDLERRTP